MQWTLFWGRPCSTEICSNRISLFRAYPSVDRPEKRKMIRAVNAIRGFFEIAVAPHPECEIRFFRFFIILKNCCLLRCMIVLYLKFIYKPENYMFIFCFRSCGLVQVSDLNPSDLSTTLLCMPNYIYTVRRQKFGRSKISRSEMSFFASLRMTFPGGGTGSFRSAEITLLKSAVKRFCKSFCQTICKPYFRQICTRAKVFRYF